MEDGTRKSAALDLYGRADQIIVCLDTGTYPRSAILRALYWLAADGSFEITEEAPGRLKLMITPLQELSSEVLLAKLHQSLIDFAVRYDVETKTATIRDLIWRTAFAESTGLKP